MTASGSFSPSGGQKGRGGRRPKPYRRSDRCGLNGSGRVGDQVRVTLVGTLTEYNEDDGVWTLVGHSHEGHVDWEYHLHWGTRFEPLAEAAALQEAIKQAGPAIERIAAYVAFHTDNFKGYPSDWLGIGYEKAPIDLADLRAVAALAESRRSHD